MSDQNTGEPREVELVFEDEAGGPGSGRAADERSARSAAPRFTQSSSSRSYESRPEGVRSYTPFGSEGGPSRSYSSPNPGRRQAARGDAPSGRSSASAPGGECPRPGGGFEDRPFAEGDARGAVATHALPTGPLSTPVLAGSAVAVGLLGILAANARGSFARAGLSAPLVGAEGVLLTLTTDIGYLFSSFGAILLVLAAWVVLRHRGERASASALIVGMWSAWLVSSAVSALAIGTVPYIVSVIAFPAALATVVLALMRGGRRRGFPLASVLAGGLLVAVTALFIAVGKATLLGAGASVLVGAAGALLGLRLWNRWWAPILDARERFRSMMGSGFDAKLA